MDGTLYLGDKLYDFTIELLDTLKATGRKYLFMTNNSSKSVADYIKRLSKLKIEPTGRILSPLPRPRSIICTSTTKVRPSTPAVRNL